MVFHGPAAWAETREAEWERDATHGLADQEAPEEREWIADQDEEAGA